MKKAYKQAMEQVAVSDHMRTRILAAAKPQKRYRWVRSACGAAACFALLCTVGLIGMQAVGVKPESAMDSNMGMAKTAADGGTAAEAELYKDDLADYVTADEAVPEENDSDGGYGADAKSETDSLPEEGTANTMVVNPLKKYDTLKDALNVLEFSPVIPEEAMDGDITVINGEILQLCWEESDVSYTYRTGFADGDISGVYMQWEQTEAVAVEGLTSPVTLKGNGTDVSLANWTQDGMAFSLRAEPGVEKDTILSIIE